MDYPFLFFSYISRASSFRVHKSSALLDLRKLVDYFGTSGMIENVSGDNDDIDACQVNHCQPDTSKYSHLHPKNLEQTSHEGTIPSSADMPGIYLILVLL